MMLHGPIIQPISESQKKRSSARWSKPSQISLPICARHPACVWTVPFGLPVVPEVYRMNARASESSEAVGAAAD